jgi:hypothetical protein
MRVAVLLTLGFGLLAAGDVMPSHPESWGWVKTGVELSALGALIAGFGYLLRVEIPALRKQNVEQQDKFSKILGDITNRWDGWEKIRHDDHESIQTVLRETVVGCAETRAAMLEASDRDHSRSHKKGP